MSPNRPGPDPDPVVLSEEQVLAFWAGGFVSGATSLMADAGIDAAKAERVAADALDIMMSDPAFRDHLVDGIRALQGQSAIPETRMTQITIFPAGD